MDFRNKKLDLEQALASLLTIPVAVIVIGVAGTVLRSDAVNIKPTQSAPVEHDVPTRPQHTRTVMLAKAPVQSMKIKVG